MNFLMLSKTARPSSMAATMVPKLSSARIMSAGFLGAPVPPNPHRNPDIRLLQRGRIVHAVACYRDDLAQGLEDRHDPELVIGRDPGEEGLALGPEFVLGGAVR